MVRSKPLERTSGGVAPVAAHVERLPDRAMSRRRQAWRLDRTLDQIEGTTWGPPTYGSHLVRTCHRLRTVPLRDFTVEDLRIMIGQKISLVALLPLALDVLEANPLSSGDFYPGDLLSSVVRARDEWPTDRVLRARMRRILGSALSQLDVPSGGGDSFEINGLSTPLTEELQALFTACLATLDS